jgi:uncharacterized protein
MLRRLFLFVAGLAFLVLGLIGLLMPFLPGLLFLAIAVLCFAGASPAVGRRLRADPRYRRWRARWESRRNLRPADRLRLTFWLGLSVVLSPWRRGRAWRGRG